MARNKNSSLTFFCALFAAFFFAPQLVLATAENAGVPKEAIWFSKDPIKVGDEVVVYVPVFNASTYRFRGSALLEDRGTVIGAKDFSLVPSGGSVILAFPWKATYGEHSFSVSIKSGEFFVDNKNFVDLSYRNRTAESIERFVEGNKSESSNEESVSGDDTQYFSIKIPSAAISEAVPILGGIEQFRVQQAKRSMNIVGDIQAILVSGESATSTQSPAVASTTTLSGWKTIERGITGGDIVRTPWQYAKLFFMLLYQFITTNIYAFYIFLAYLSYKIIRRVLSFFF